MYTYMDICIYIYTYLYIYAYVYKAQNCYWVVHYTGFRNMMGLRLSAVDRSGSRHNSELVETSLPGCPCPNPKAPSTQHLRVLIPETILLMVFGSRVLKGGCLEPLGKVFTGMVVIRNMDL